MINDDPFELSAQMDGSIHLDKSDLLIWEVNKWRY